MAYAKLNLQVGNGLPNGKPHVEVHLRTNQLLELRNALDELLGEMETASDSPRRLVRVWGINVNQDPNVKFIPVMQGDV